MTKGLFYAIKKPKGGKIMTQSVVTAGQQMALSAELSEIDRQLRNQEGYPYNLKRLKAALKAVASGQFDAIRSPFASELFAREFIPEGLRVMDDVEPSMFQAKDTEYISVIDRKREKHIGGVALRERAFQRGAYFGIVDGKRLLSQQADIPAGLRSKIIALPGTLLQRSDEALGIAYLAYQESESRWSLEEVGWLAYDWHDFVVVPRLKRDGEVVQLG